MSIRIRRRRQSTSQRVGSKRRELDNSDRRTLRAARLAAKLTQRQLAARAGVDHSFISLMESGGRSIRMSGYETVVLIARALNNDVEELFPVPVVESAQEHRDA